MRNLSVRKFSVAALLLLAADVVPGTAAEKARSEEMAATVAVPGRETVSLVGRRSPRTDS